MSGSVPVINEDAMDKFVKIFRENGAPDSYIKQIVTNIFKESLKKAMGK